MRVRILIDNITHSTLKAEWGLSIHIEYQGMKVLLDMGASDYFARNADALGIDLKQVDYAVLSHAHYDHADGLETFLEMNRRAGVYIQAEAGEIIYSRCIREWIFLYECELFKKVPLNAG